MHIQIPKSDEPPPVKCARPESELFAFQIYLDKASNIPPLSQSLKWSQQLYIIYSFMCYPAFCVVIWS